MEVWNTPWQGLGIPFARTQVGDKFMLRELGKRGWDLAAEASGHIIQKHLGPSRRRAGHSHRLPAGASPQEAPSSRWAWRFEPWPLKLVNIQARDRRPVEECERLRSVMAELAMRHGSALRMVVRWSGTEPKLRLMVEAQDERRMLEALQGLEGAARADLGL